MDEQDLNPNGMIPVPPRPSMPLDESPAGEDLKSMLKDTLSMEIMAGVRSQLEQIEPGLLGIFALVDIPEKGLALVASGAVPDKDMFEILKFVVNQAPIMEFRQDEGLPEVADMMTITPPEMRTLDITGIIEEDEDRILFSGTEVNGDPVSFHLSRNDQVNHMLEHVRKGEPVQIELPKSFGAPEETDVQEPPC